MRMGKKASAGKAQIEGETLIFRGDFRLAIPFDQIREVAVDGDALVLATDEEIRFELGASVAGRWMKLIKQPKGLLEKLEIGPQSRVAVVEVNDTLFLTGLRERAASVAEGRVPGGTAIIFLGAETREALRKLPLLRARMVDSGTLWIVRPKGNKAISELEVLDAAREVGLVDTKVVAFSKTHSAHKCVIPIEMRGQARRRPPILTIPPSAPVLDASKAGARATTKSGKASAPPAASKKHGAKEPTKRSR
ncbi:MAG: DUF3052 domain-containing protein [Myxococcota bacterium]|nr:DUF3052 domain-containing protein [Myxococcota bacterium]